MLNINTIIKETNNIELKRFVLHSEKSEEIRQSVNYNFKYNNKGKIICCDTVFISLKDFNKCKKYLNDKKIKFDIFDCTINSKKVLT